MLSNYPGLPCLPVSLEQLEKIKAGIPLRMATRLSLIRSVAFRPCFTTGLAFSLCELQPIKKLAIRFAAFAVLLKLKVNDGPASGSQSGRLGFRC